MLDFIKSFLPAMLALLFTAACVVALAYLRSSALQGIVADERGADKVAADIRAFARSVAEDAETEEEKKALEQAVTELMTERHENAQRVADRRSRFNKVAGGWQRDILVTPEELRDVEQFYGGTLHMPVFHRSLPAPHRPGVPVVEPEERRVVFSHWEGQLAFIAFRSTEDSALLDKRVPLEFTLRLSPTGRGAYPWFRLIGLELNSAGIPYEAHHFNRVFSLYMQDPIGNDIWLYSSHNFEFLSVAELKAEYRDDPQPPAASN